MRALLTAAIALGLTAMLAAPARAGEVTFFVGGDEAKGKELAAAAGGKYTKENLAKAFGWAAEAMKGGKEDVSVTIKVAAGDYGCQYDFPAFGSALKTRPRPEYSASSLRISGGWDASFGKRDPFRTPTRFISPTPRKGPMLKFQKEDKLKAFALDGILFDAAPGNKYDEKTNSIKKGESNTDPIIRFVNLTVDQLAIEHCVFMNAAERAFETLVFPASDSSTVRLYNSVFLNCIIPVKLDSCRGKRIPVLMDVDHCSFLLNFGFNPDPDTSNPAALELGGKYAASEIVVQNSLFYANFGGGIMNIETSQTKVTVKNNNFVGNGLLHGKPEIDACAMIVGQKMPIPVKKIVDEEEDPTLAGNVSIPPGIALELGSTKPVDSSKVQPEKTWENEVNRILGRPLQGGTVKIKDFAPKKEWDPANPPFPTNDEAKKYGASPDLVK
jgi:hypothetical protein